MSAPRTYGERNFMRPLQDGPPRFSSAIPGRRDARIMEEDFLVLTSCYEKFEYTLGTRHPKRLKYYLVEIGDGRTTEPSMMRFTLKWATIPATYSLPQPYNVSTDVLTGMGDSYAELKFNLDLIELKYRKKFAGIYEDEAMLPLIPALAYDAEGEECTVKVADGTAFVTVRGTEITWKRLISRNGTPEHPTGVNIPVPKDTPSVITRQVGQMNTSQNSRRTYPVISNLVYTFHLVAEGDTIAPLLPAAGNRIVEPSQVTQFLGPIWQRATRYV